jgi:hypothetical protein
VQEFIPSERVGKALPGSLACLWKEEVSQMMIPSRKRTLLALFAIPVLIIPAMLSGGCASMGVEPWERGIMAEEEMSLDADPLDSIIDDHIYFSKEASSGGRGFGGGGCGCN